MRSTEDDDQDHALVRQVLAGDEEAFERLVERHHDRIHRLARSVLQNDAAAEDVAQETFLRAYRALPRFRGDASLRTWLSRITVNLCLTQRRREARPPLAPDPALEPPPDQDPAALVETAQRHAAVRAAVERLPPHYRIVIVLSRVEELPYQEIADLLQLPLGTVKSRISFATGLLRQALARPAP